MVGRELFYSNLRSKKKSVIHRRMREPCVLMVRRYVDCLIVLNKYLDSLPGAKLSEKNGTVELNEILLNSMPNSCSNKAYVQVFDCEPITFKKDVDIFEQM